MRTGPTSWARCAAWPRTSGAVGGIGLRVARQRVFGTKGNQAAHAEDLKILLGGLKGPLMKVAQFLSHHPGRAARRIRRRTGPAPGQRPRPWATPSSAAAWPVSWALTGSPSSPASARRPPAAASLGQVHRATLHDGTQVACKLQYPDMASTMEADLRQLRLGMSVYKRMEAAINLDDIYDGTRRPACARNSTTAARPPR